MKASFVVVSTGAAVLLATSLLAMANDDAESPATSRELKKGRRQGRHQRDMDYRLSMHIWSSSRDGGDKDHGRHGHKKHGGRSHKKKGCADPVQAVRDLLECIEKEDVECAAAAYDPGFERFHNEEFSGEIPVNSTEFWTGAFSVTDLSFDIRFISVPQMFLNRASVRYIEKVVTDDGTSFGLPASSEYPFNHTILQHEHALVDVDDDCKILKWDQYGDDTEQTDVDIAVQDLLCAIGSANCSDDI